MILQDICKQNLDWDDPLDDELKDRWENWLHNIFDLERLNVARCYKPPDFGTAISVELHHFADASLTGYGACSYLRQKNAEHKVHCGLVLAKSRVAPLKTVTVPRLELAAAVTAAKISKMLDSELDFKKIVHRYWSDSTSVLGFLSNPSKRQEIFVANRVQQIRDLSSPEQWGHVRSEENPADLASRGCTAKELLECPTWLNGPAFIWASEIPEPMLPSSPVKQASCLATTGKKEWSILSTLRGISSWPRMKRVIVLCKGVRARLTKTRTIATSVEALNAAELFIIKLVQAEGFGQEISDLSSDEVVKLTSTVASLDPFLDEDGVLRVGGRLKNSEMLYSAKHPALLPKDDPISVAILRHFHEKIAHQGRSATVNEARASGFWVVGASSMAGKLTTKCVSCRKMRGEVTTQKMADLPRDRVEPAPPFTNVGVDFFGPFLVKEGRKEMKRWGCIFTCLASRGVHLEVANSLSTDCFINILRRFIAIRGAVARLRSDRGTNFVGADRELKLALGEIDHEMVRKYLENRGCDFVFNPPHASHMGGVWECPIRNARNVLTHLLKESGTQLDNESLRTLMAEAAAVINSKPLTTDNVNDPTTLAPITPNHLLTAKSSVIVPPPGEFCRADLYCRKRWRRVQHLTNVFWSRWRKEFLQHLQQRQKWLRPKRDLQPGDIVLIKNDELPRNQWRLGRVLETEAGDDDRIRKAKIAVGDPLLDRKGRRRRDLSKLDRPVSQLVLLLSNEEQSDELEYPSEE